MKAVLNLRFGRYFLDLNETHVERLRTRFPSVRFVDLKKDDPAFEAEVADAEALVTYPFKVENFARALGGASRLKWIQFSYVGIAPEFVRLAREKNWLLSSARGVASDAIAVHAMSLLLAFERKLHLAFRFQKEKNWNPFAFTEGKFGFGGLRGKTMGIVGLGSIGARLTALARGFGMRVWGIKRNIASAPTGVERVLPPSSLNELLRESDVVVLAVPLIAETEKLIGEAELRAMKPGAYLLNVARGNLIDEPALAAALREGRIAGAALDVAAAEPLPADSPLYDLDNLILTPHIAGLDRLYTDSLIEIFMENLDHYLNGKPLKNQVDLAKGY